MGEHTAEFAHIEFERSEHGYGWWLTLSVRGKHRVRWCSRKATTRMWPRFINGSDEDCNRSTSLVLWPLGCLDVWWEPKWRPAGSGLCDACKAEFTEVPRWCAEHMEPYCPRHSTSPAGEDR